MGADSIFYESILGFRIVVLISFILEIFVNFNTAYYKHGMIIFNRQEIFETYINDKIFLCDLIPLIPIFASFNPSW